jgi:hypothetical protein
MPLLLAPTTAPPDLRDRLADLRRRWRLLVVVRGVGGVVAIILAAVVGVGLLDHTILLPALVRAAVLVGLLALASFAVIQIIRQLRDLKDELAIALHVEDHFPTLNDALASAVQFDLSPDGSSELRHATRRYAVRQAADCNFRDLLDRRPARRALTALAVALALAATFTLLWPSPTLTAAVRLLDPFGDHPWPLQTVLSLDAPEWLARGEPFILRGTLDGLIPERVSFGFSLDGTPPNEQPVPVLAGDTGGSFVVRLEPNRVPRGFRYRVRANDAESGWRAVRVLTPPQLAPLDGRPSPQVHLDFPIYTDVPPRDLPDGGGSIECIAGTLVRLRAATDRPVARAWIELAADPPRPTVAAGLLALGAAGPASAIGLSAAGQAVWGEVPAALDAAGTRFELTFRPYVDGLYVLRFEDESGLGGRRTLHFRVQPDPTPALTLERPAASQDNLSVLPDGSLPLVARADDPVFAVRSAWLEFRCGKDEPTQQLPLYDHQAIGAAVPRMLAAAAPPLRLRLPLVSVERRLEMTGFRHADGRPLAAGDTVTIQVVADDFDDVTVPKPAGHSHEVEIHIVSPAALQTVLHKAEADLQRELKEMLRLQQDALAQTAPAEVQRRQSGALKPDDVERLVHAEQLQQQLRARVGTSQEGLRSAVDRLRRALRDNPLPPTPERDRLDALAAELDRLGREDLEPIEPLLAEARKERGPVAAEARKAGPLPKAVEHQRESERTLRDMLDQLQPWTDAREMRAEAGALARDQEKAARDRADLEAQGSIGRPRDQLLPDQRQQLDRLAERQAALADRAGDLLDKVDRKLGEKQAAVAAKEAEAAAKEAQAAEKERQEQPAGDLRREAQEARESAAIQRREADALAAARDAAQRDPGQLQNATPPADPTLRGRQKEAADNIERNDVGHARQAQEAADRMLKAMQDALQEKSTPDGDRLAKKQKLDAAERDLDALIHDQEQIQQRVEEAGRIADPAERKQELQRLAREQEKVQERARELAQRLTRLRGEQAGQDLRRAARAMDQARDAMDQGDPAGDKQDDALDRLDDAQDQLAQARKDAEEELQREMRARLLDALKGLKERQESQVAESERLFQAAKQAGSWSRPLQKSLADMVAAETALGGEVGPLSEKYFQDAKVIAHVVRQAAEALAAVEPAVEAVRNGPMDAEMWDADRTAVQAPQRLALKRLAQLIDVLQEDEKDRQERRTQPGQPAGGATGGGAGGDGIPPLAQLKLLRALQAEVNERTEAFAKAHPDPSKLSPEQQAELDAVRSAQAELAALLEELAPPEPPTEPPAKEKP